MLPRSLKVGGRKYKLQQVGALELSPNEDADINRETGVIRINRRSSPRYKVECVLHEVFHAILGKSTLGPESEEALVLILERDMVDFLKDNKPFIHHVLNTLTD